MARRSPSQTLKVISVLQRKQLKTTRLINASHSEKALWKRKRAGATSRFNRCAVASEIKFSSGAKALAALPVFQTKKAAVVDYEWHAVCVCSLVAVRAKLISHRQLYARQLSFIASAFDSRDAFSRLKKRRLAVFVVCSSSCWSGSSACMRGPARVSKER